MFSLSKNQKTNILFTFFIFVYVSLQYFQIELAPLQRYPNWDAFWVDSINYGQLAILKNALFNFEIPAISPYSNFGMSFAGDAANPVSSLNPIHWTVAFLNPEKVIQLRAFILFLIGMGSSFLFLQELTKNRLFSFFISMLYISLGELIISPYYETLYMSFVYFTPGFFYIIHKIYLEKSLKWIFLFYLYSLISSITMNVYGFIAFPSVIGVYTFLIGLSYFDQSLKNSLLTSIGLVALWLMSSACYLFPFLDNAMTVNIAMKEISSAGIYTPSVLSVSDFFSFFMKHMFSTFFFPLFGMLYVPFFFYFSIVFALLFKKGIFQGNLKKLFSVICTILIVTLFLFLISVVIYSIPFLAEKTPSILRMQTYLFPFLILLASSLCIYAATLSVIKNGFSYFGKTKALFLLFTAMIIPFFIEMIFYNSHHSSYINSFTNIFSLNFYNLIYHSSQLPCCNTLPIPLKKDLWKLFPFVHLGISLTIILVSWTQNLSPSLEKFKYSFILLFSVFISLFSFSYMNQLKNQHAPWDWQSNSPHLWDGYKQRRDCINKLIDRSNSTSLMNYRTLYTGKDDGSGRARNWKLIAETEAHPADGEKVLFPYREVINPYTSLLWSAFFKGQRFLAHSHFPPVYSTVSNSLDLARFLGVKWIISADQKLENSALIYKGSCHTEIGGPLKAPHEAGDFYVYELSNPLGIAFFMSNFKILETNKILNLLYKQEALPWLNKIVYLEENPGILRENLNSISENNDSNDFVQITHETLSKVYLNTYSSQEKFLVLTYAYSPKWSAYIDNVPQKIFRAYGGFMAIVVPSGKHIIEFIYNPVDVYLGLGISFSVLIIIIIFLLMRRKKTAVDFKVN